MHQNKYRDWNKQKIGMLKKLIDYMLGREQRQRFYNLTYLKCNCKNSAKITCHKYSILLLQDNITTNPHVMYGKMVKTIYNMITLILNLLFTNYTINYIKIDSIS